MFLSEMLFKEKYVDWWWVGCCEVEKVVYHILLYNECFASQHRYERTPDTRPVEGNVRHGPLQATSAEPPGILKQRRRNVKS